MGDLVLVLDMASLPTRLQMKRPSGKAVLAVLRLLGVDDAHWDRAAEHLATDLRHQIPRKPRPPRTKGEALAHALKLPCFPDSQFLDLESYTSVADLVKYRPVSNPLVFKGEASGLHLLTNGSLSFGYDRFDLDAQTARDVLRGVLDGSHNPGDFLVLEDNVWWLKEQPNHMTGGRYWHLVKVGHDERTHPDKNHDYLLDRYRRR